MTYSTAISHNVYEIYEIEEVPGKFLLLMDSLNLFSLLKHFNVSVQITIMINAIVFFIDMMKNQTILSKDFPQH